jgi:5-methylcytosine-specific restriction endonuclease McrA
MVLEENPKYVPYHICGFVDFVKYELRKRNYGESEIQELKSMPYKEYLKTEHWGLLKNAVYGKYGRTCMVCGLTHTEVHAHHHRYINRGNEDIDDMVCLCKNCHRKLHGIKEYKYAENQPHNITRSI